MEPQRVNFDSAEVIEAGRKAAHSMELICNSTRHGQIVLDVTDGVVVQCETLIRERCCWRKPGTGDPKAREPV